MSVKYKFLFIVFLVISSFNEEIIIVKGQKIYADCLQPGIRSNSKLLSEADFYPDRFRIKYECHPNKEKELTSLVAKVKKFRISNNLIDIMKLDYNDILGGRLGSYFYRECYNGQWLDINSIPKCGELLYYL